MPASDWLSADEVTALAAAYGSPDRALVILLARPGVCDELYALGVRNLSGYGQPDDPDVLMPAENERFVWRRVADGLLGEDDEKPTTSEPDAATQKPTANEAEANRVDVPYALAEKAVRLHVSERWGRRLLNQNIPGLGDWGARAVVYSYDADKRFGLWLDDQEQLCWGPAITPVWDREQQREQRGQAIAPAPVTLRLPRP